MKFAAQLDSDRFRFSLKFLFKDILACAGAMALVFVVLALTGPLGATMPVLSL